MKPKIDSTSFGSITVEGKIYENDILILRSGQIEKRKKKLSKEVYGTSHKISFAEAKHISEKGTEKIIIGTVYRNRSDRVCRVLKKSKGNVTAMFHVTC